MRPSSFRWILKDVNNNNEKKEKNNENLSTFVFITKSQFSLQSVRWSTHQLRSRKINIRKFPFSLVLPSTVTETDWGWRQSYSSIPRSMFVTRTAIARKVKTIDIRIVTTPHTRIHRHSMAKIRRCAERWVRWTWSKFSFSCFFRPTKRWENGR